MILYKGYFDFCNYIYLNETNKQVIDEKKRVVKTLLLSSTSIDGKTCLLLRLNENIFHETLFATMGIEYKMYSYEYNKKNF